ncbi:MAG: glycoside hydrolase family 2 TIM barrel-domain containing protein, partial [Kiritimatiellia bacterium]|nr:glycoside hydrolase family 2 TIM barrel-domain containing protein [Kiritimatiellia bacterium]
MTQNPRRFHPLPCTFIALALWLGWSARLPAETGSDLSVSIRHTLNLAGEWEAQSTDSFRFVLPAPTDGWTPETVPSPEGKTERIQSIRGPYVPQPAQLLNDAGTGFRQTTRLGAWFRRSFQVSADSLQKGLPVLYLHGASFRSHIWLNGRNVGESVQCAVPLEFDLTGILRAGENELLIGLTGREGIFDLEHKTYITPSSGMQAGLRGPIEIRFLPLLHVTDTFIRTPLDPKRIEIDVTVRNASDRSARFTPEAVLTRQEPNAPILLRLTGSEQTLPAGGTGTITLNADWPDAELWELDRPVLHVAEVQLRDPANRMLDRHQTRFGFRNFEIRGRDFFLNGRRITLLRDSSLTSLGGPPHDEWDPRSDARGANSTRLHIGFNNEGILDHADLTGRLTVPESSWFTLSMYPSGKKDLWLPNVLEYFTRWIRLHRNRPSVAFWSLTNETYWDYRRPEDLAIAQVILDHVAALDPTRPLDADAEVGWVGRLPILNIHYPEGTAGPLRLRYPNSGLTVPNDLEWLNPEGISRSWRAEFRWDRPLVIGEYWHLSGSPDALSSFMGDAVYDWERWRKQNLNGRRQQSDESYDNPYMETLKKATDYYRRMGVAGLNTWSGDRAVIHPAVAVRPTDFHPNFSGGGELTRGLVVFYDQTMMHSQLHVLADLAAEGTTIAQTRLPVQVQPGGRQELRLTLPLPETDRVIPATLTVRLRYWARGGYHEFNRFQQTVYLVPPPRLNPDVQSAVALYDPAGSTAAALARAGLAAPQVDDLSADVLSRARLVIFGENAFDPKFSARLDEYIERGGRVLMLRQADWRPWRAELPERDLEHAATESWVRARHPALDGMEDGQFRHWRPDNLVSTETFWKPAQGRMSILLDAGGRYGMRWSPLLSVRLGSGEIFLTTLPLVDALDREPAAGALLAGLIHAATSAPPTPPVQLNLLTGAHPDLQNALALVGAVTSEGLGQQGPILVDASARIDPQTLSGLRSALAAGRTVWMHGFDETTLPAVAELFPYPPALEPPDPTVQSATLRAPGPLTAGLASFDFYWTRVDLGARQDYFESGRPTTPMGTRIL